MGNLPVRPSEIRSDTFLTTYALEYGNKDGVYAAKKMASVVNSNNNPTGKYHIWDAKASFANRGYGYRASGGNLERLEWSKTTGTYSCEPRGFETIVTERDQKLYQGPEDWRTVKTRQLVRTQRDSTERLVAAKLHPDNCTYTTTASGTTQWSHASSTPFTAIKTAIASVRKYSGMRPNVFGCPFDVAMALINHADFIDRFKGWTSTVNNVMLPTPFFGMTPVMLDAVGSSTNINQDSVTLGDIWGKHCWFMYVEPDATRESMTAAAMFEEYDDIVDFYTDETVKGEVVRIERSDDIEILCQGAIYVIKNVIA